MSLHIVCLPDLLRSTQAFSNGFFDLVREPIRQGCGIDVAYPPGHAQPCNLAPGFRLEEFYRLIHDNHNQPAWELHFHAIPEAATTYLLAHIPQGSLLLTFEMPPWLLHLCSERNIDFIDIRLSPLRFGRDLYVALRTGNPELYQRIETHRILSEELRLEAQELAAGVRMHQQHLTDANRYSFNLDGTLIFIGQAPFDASLLSTRKTSPLNCTDFAGRLRQLAQGRRVLHKPHPTADWHAALEQQQLQDILQTDVQPCMQNAYQILSSRHDVILTSISSGMLQEAIWFDKPAHILFQPFTPLAIDINSHFAAFEAYQQVHFETWLSPGFWHSILAPERTSPRILRLSPRQHHHARHLLDHWWDYSKVMTWERSLPYEAFMRSGGAQHRDRIASLEKKNEHENLLDVRESRENSGGNELNQDLLGSLYSRLSDGYRSVEEALSKNTSLGYKNKTLDSVYYQDLHETNHLFQTNNWLLPYVNFIRSKQFSSIREIGCGNGAFSSEIAKFVTRVLAVDWAKSPAFPEKENISFRQQDITTAELEFVDLNCSADVLEHIAPEKLVGLIKNLHISAQANFHVIACYDDGHSHLSIFPPDAWLFLFRQVSSDYRILDISIRRNNISHVICVLTNI